VFPSRLPPTKAPRRLRTRQWEECRWRRNALLAERTREREVRRTAVARGHERARWKRADDAHHRSRRRVDAFDRIAIEALALSELVRNGRLAKNLHAALIACTVSGAGGRFVAMDPAHTSPDYRS
jgi:hypothetical protein